jgi:hypothetical protein
MLGTLGLRSRGIRPRPLAAVDEAITAYSGDRDRCCVSGRVGAIRHWTRRLPGGVGFGLRFGAAGANRRVDKPYRPITPRLPTTATRIGIEDRTTSRIFYPPLAELSTGCHGPDPMGPSNPDRVRRATLGRSPAPTRLHPARCLNRRTRKRCQPDGIIAPGVLPGRRRR